METYGARCIPSPSDLTQSGKAILAKNPNMSVEDLRKRLLSSVDKLPALQPNQLFEITLEPPSGSPTGRPTGPIQYIGRAVKLSS